MRMRVFASLLLLASVCLGPLAISQTEAPVEARKVLQRIMPVYPDIAKRMNLTGSVKVLVTVSPDGKVKTVQPMGGSPVLIQAVENAVNKWKFAPGSTETKELIELKFDGVR